MAYLNGMTEKFAVIALGGNAILRKDQTANSATQMANLRIAVNNLAVAIKRYDSFALTHGNGPQVGNDLIRSYYAKQAVGLPELGLADCVANTQGRIGHWIAREMKNHPTFRSYPVACILTHVFTGKYVFTPDEFIKGIGPWWKNTPELRSEWESRGIIFKTNEDESEIRRLVPSPEPYKIHEFETIADLLKSRVITICCGGGGIPIYDPYIGVLNPPEDIERFRQCEVVIDKDRASSLLAIDLLEEIEGADIEFVILMDAKGLYRDSRCREEDFVKEMTLYDLNLFLSANDLDKGTIKPKLEAIRDFLEAGGREAWLGPLDGFEKVFDPSENIGTRFIQSPQLKLYE